MVHLAESKTMGYQRRSESASHSARTSKNQTAPGTAAEHPRYAAALSDAIRQASQGNYQKALTLLGDAERNSQFSNVRGVCLLRMGRVDDAVQVFRRMVLNPGCTWMRADVPAVYKTNYATALLMSGHPSGCLDMLADTKDEANPAVRKLRGAIQRWEKSLSWWSWLNWKLLWIEPHQCRVELGFLPGDFETPVDREGETPQPTSPDDSLHTAA